MKLCFKIPPFGGIFFIKIDSVIFRGHLVSCVCHQLEKVTYLKGKGDSYEEKETEIEIDC